MPTPETALPGRDIKMPVPPIHEVLSEPLTPPFAEPSERIVFGMGCFWGAERVFGKPRVSLPPLWDIRLV